MSRPCRLGGGGNCSGRGLTPATPIQEVAQKVALPQEHTQGHWCLFGARVHELLLTAEGSKLHMPKPLALQELLHLNVFYVVCELFMR